jgi:hypothetical protein
MTFIPLSSDSGASGLLTPFAKFFRTFQSNAVLRAFSTDSAPPLMKNRFGSSGGAASVPKVSTRISARPVPPALLEILFPRAVKTPS